MAIDSSFGVFQPEIGRALVNLQDPNLTERCRIVKRRAPGACLISQLLSLEDNPVVNLYRILRENPVRISFLAEESQPITIRIIIDSRTNNFGSGVTITGYVIDEDGEYFDGMESGQTIIAARIFMSDRSGHIFIPKKMLTVMKKRDQASKLSR